MKQQNIGKQNIGKITVLLAIAATCVANPSAFGSLTFTGSSGSLNAKVDFNLSGSTLTVTLANTSTSDVLVPTDVLTGVFFNTTHALTAVSASLNGSSVFYGSITDVGGGWGYASGVAAQGKNSAISASGAVNGLGHSNFSGANNPLQGLGYGILSTSDNTATGNTGVTGHGPLIKNSVQFILTAAQGFTLDELGNSVVFQYGTSLTETHCDGNPTPTAVPEPTTVIAGALLLLPLGASALRIPCKNRADKN